jgi:hypothetical protein
MLKMDRLLRYLTAAAVFLIPSLTYASVTVAPFVAGGPVFSATAVPTLTGNLLIVLGLLLTVCELWP